MGKIGVTLTIGGISESEIAAVKTALDNQIATWTTDYPTLTFSRGTLQWNE
jgi:hypothetical protein